MSEVNCVLEDVSIHSSLVFLNSAMVKIQQLSLLPCCGTNKGLF